MNGGWRPLLAALLLTAGCVGTEAPDDTGGTTDASGDAATDPTAGDENATTGPALDTPTPQTWYLTRDLSYDTDPAVLGEGVRVTLDPLTDALAGAPLTSFEYTRPTDATTALVITDVSLTYHYTRDTPAVRDPQIPPFAAFWGLGDGTVLIEFAEGPAAVSAGEVIEVTMPFELPPGGLVFPPGSTVWASIFGAYHPSDRGTAAGYVIVEDADRPTRFEGTYYMTAWPDVAGETQLLSETGTLQGGECTPMGQTEESYALHPFEVGPDVVGLKATLTRTGGQGQLPDVDLDILGPGGEVVGGGHSPYADEVASVYLPNIDAVGTGTWSAEVNVCSAQTAEYAVTVVALVGAPDADAGEDTAS